MKILAIQFKYYGDAVMMVPALRALREHFPDSALHALVPREVAPLLEHLPWLNRVWPMTRIRGRAGLRSAWPVIRALRAERFDRSVDFGGNDRGAILSRLSGARVRLGIRDPQGFLGRRFCYTERVAPAARDQHESQRLLHLLSAWGIPPSTSLTSEIHTTPAQDRSAARVLPENRILCHITSSQPKKEWPVSHWAAFQALAAAAGLELVFSAGLGKREQSVLEEFQRLAPAAPVLPADPDLGVFLAVIKRARAFVSGDTGPLHFAAGLGVPTLGLFGPSSAAQWRPWGPGHQVLSGGVCGCRGDAAVCHSAVHCLGLITPAQALDSLRQLLAGRQKNCFPPKSGEHVLGIET